MPPILPPSDPLVLSAYFDDAPQDYDELGQCWSDDDLMHGDGQEFDDAEYNIAPLRLTSVASVLQPSDPSRAYIFCGNRYVMTKVLPGAMGDRTTRGSNIIVDDWPSLWRTKFSGKIDAVLPSPANNKHMYFFSFENYALINADPGS